MYVGWRMKWRWHKQTRSSQHIGQSRKGMTNGHIVDKIAQSVCTRRSARSAASEDLSTLSHDRMASDYLRGGWQQEKLAGEVQAWQPEDPHRRRCSSRVEIAWEQTQVKKWCHALEACRFTGGDVGVEKQVWQARETYRLDSRQKLQEVQNWKKFTFRKVNVCVHYALISCLIYKIFWFMFYREVCLANVNMLAQP